MLWVGKERLCLYGKDIHLLLLSNLDEDSEIF